jgi:subtilisin family serine protease
MRRWITLASLCLVASLGRAADPVGVWIVTFVDPPLAAHDGSRMVSDRAGKRLAPASLTESGKLDLQDSAALGYLAHLDQQHAAFLDALGARGKRAPTPRFRYRVVANGMALEMDAAGAAAARQIAGVAAVEPDFQRRVATDAGPAWIGAEAFWNDAVPGATGLGRGAGAVVGVIDTGIKPDHPAFAARSEDGFTHANPRGGFLGLCAATPARCNSKLIGIHDFTSEGSRDGSDLNGHGTHVASTAAGNLYTAPASTLTAGQPLRVSGVAPRANLVSYKACIDDPDNPDSSGSCSGSALIAAIDRATADGVDVINYSIGSDTPRDPWAGVRGNSNDDARALLNARAAGVLAVVSAGNSGPQASTINAPGNAPWVLTAAASSHNRRFETVLAGLQGSGVNAPLSFRGAALDGALERRRLVHAKDYGNALCGTGPSQGTAATGASNPFAAGTFNGEIVICVRGIYARVEKSFNVRQAGAGGFVLVNALADAESIVSDNHGMPAVHIGYVAGQQLQALVENARLAGGQISATILATQRVLDDAIGDRMASFSSRGPVLPFGGWLKPNLAAPGLSILAADNESNGLAVLQGTSMSAPHIAGAAALLAAARPNWSVAQLESALLTTARSSGMLREDAVTAATPHDSGAGRVRVDEAVRAGLWFDISRAMFVAGDPLLGGQPDAASRINHPSLTSGSCIERCSFTRTATATEGGGWRIESRLPSGALVSVTPSTFSLGSGQTQELRFEFDVSNPALAGAWVYGEIALISTSGGIEQRLPVALLATAGPLPTRFEATATATSGATDVVLDGLAALPDATFRATPLVRMETASAVLGSRGELDSYESTGSASIVGTLVIAGVAGERVGYQLFAEASSATSRDVDLFIGQDLDGDNAPDAFEELCVANGSTASERCTIDVQLEGSGDQRSYWIYAINQRAGVSGSDTLSLRYAAIPLSGPPAVAGGTSLVAMGPGRVAARTPFTLRLAWDAPAMLPGELWTGLVELGATRGNPGQIGRIPLLLSASPALQASAQLLDARSDSLRLRLLPGTSHERIALDVPPTTTGLIAQLDNAGGVDLFVARAVDPGTGPAIAAAPPRSAASASALGADAAKRVQLGGASLAPGRWYLTPVNRGTATADVLLSVSTTVAGAAAGLRDNGYFNPARSGHGVLVGRAGDQLSATWFTYRADGAPTWYIAQAAAPAADAAVWHAPLRRATWNGSSGQLMVIGDAWITRTGDNQFTWSWKVDGAFGSEPLREVVGPACVDGGSRDYSGNWFDPSRPGYGYVIYTLPQAETQALFLYDGQGNPAWLYAQNSPYGSADFSLQQYSGFCPGCAAVPIGTRSAGTLRRDFSSVRTGTGTIAASFLAPLAGSWSSSDTLVRISVDLDCPR